MTSQFNGPILLLGKNGMLGSEFMQAFSYSSQEVELIALGHQDLDITNRQKVFDCITTLRPSVIINTAAYTNVDKAESDRTLAHAINALGPKYITEACNFTGSKLVHFSTDQVFDGHHKKPWQEKDTPNPSNYYAQTKLEGEQAVLKHAKAIVLRVQWLYGIRKDRFSILKEKEIFTPFSDQVGAPTWTKDITRIVMSLLNTDIAGLYHLSYDDYASWADVYNFVKHEWNLPVKLEPKKTQDVTLPANRPLYCVLSNEKLKNAIGWNSLGSWKSSLRNFLEEKSRTIH